MAEVAIGHPGLILGVARFYHDPRGSVRGMLDSGPTEARLFGYAMIAVMILMVGEIAKQYLFGGAQLVERASAEIVSMLFFVPLVYYGLAAIGTLIAKAFKGQGGWYHGRAAFFWAALVAAPLAVLSAIVPSYMMRADLPGGLILLAGQAGAIFFAWALAVAFAEAFRFSRVWAVLTVIVLPIVLPLLAIWAIRA